MKFVIFYVAAWLAVVRSEFEPGLEGSYLERKSNLALKIDDQTVGILNKDSTISNPSQKVFLKHHYPYLLSDPRHPSRELSNGQDGSFERSDLYKKLNLAMDIKDQNEEMPNKDSTITNPAQKVFVQPQYNPFPAQPGPRDPPRELPYGQDGSFKVSNKGLFVTLQFYVDYTLMGQRVRKESGVFGTGYNKVVRVPNQAEDITVTVQGVGLFGTTSDIYTRQFKYPVIRCYSSVNGQTVTQVGC